MLAYSLAKIINLLVNLFVFSKEQQIAEPKSLFKEGQSPKLQTCFTFVVITEKSIHYQLKIILKRMAYSKNIGLALEQIFQLCRV